MILVGRSHCARCFTYITPYGNTQTDFLANCNSSLFSNCYLLPCDKLAQFSGLQYKRHRRLEFDPWVRKIPWRRKWQPTPVYLPEQPMDKGASRATVQRVAKSQIPLSNWTAQHTRGFKQRTFIITQGLWSGIPMQLTGHYCPGFLKRLQSRCQPRSSHKPLPQETAWGRSASKFTHAAAGSLGSFLAVTGDTGSSLHGPLHRAAHTMTAGFLQNSELARGWEFKLRGKPQSPSPNLRSDNPYLC